MTDVSAVCLVLCWVVFRRTCCSPRWRWCRRSSAWWTHTPSGPTTTC